MGEVIAFDTYAYVKKLRDAGVDERQAAIQAETLASALAERLATKEELAKTEAAIRADLAKVEATLKADIAKTDAKIETTKAELRKDIETAKVDTVKWVVATGIVILGGVAAINRLAPPPSPIYYHQPAQEMRLPAPIPEPHQQVPVQPGK